MTLRDIREMLLAIQAEAEVDGETTADVMRAQLRLVYCMAGDAADRVILLERELEREQL